jgi:hypothetical protein
MRTKLCTIKLHSMVDVITNSSTELFCVVKAKSETEIHKVIDEILKECECEILLNGDFGFAVNPHEDWDEESPTYEQEIEGQFDITYEQHAPPCGLIKRRIKEVFEIVKEGGY